MGDLIVINQQPIEPLEYEGKRVVTLEMIDKLHERPEGTAGRNFRKNRDKFIELEDFFKIADDITNDDIRRQFKLNKHTAEIILLTESGYLMLVKSFTDPLAWDVQRQLVKTYFRASESTISLHEMSLAIQRTHELTAKNINNLSSIVGTGFFNMDKRIDNLENVQNDIVNEVGEIKNDISEIKAQNQKRKRISKKDKETHIETIYDRYNGKCPLCGDVQIIGMNMILLSNAHIDHYNKLVWDNSLQNTWIICWPCNIKRRDGKIDKDYEQKKFDAYQAELKRKSLPLFRNIKVYN